MHPHSHMHRGTHANRHTPSTPNGRQLHAGMAHRDIHMLSLDTNLAGELATTWKERESKEDGTVRVRPRLGKCECRDHLQNGCEGGRSKASVCKE